MNNTENIMIRKYETNDLSDLIRIWNQVVEDGVAFPQEEYLTETTGAEFFAQQTYTAAAVDKNTGKIYGLYILHPNNIGRCGHILMPAMRSTGMQEACISVKNW